MTKHECAIITVYTGITMLQGNDLKYLYEYIDNLMGYPVYTHEISNLLDELKEKSKPDFIKLCKEAVDK